MGANLNEDWTADVIGRMHKYRISNAQLANACGYSAAYLSTVLNGRKNFVRPENKERTKDIIFKALESIESKIPESEKAFADECYSN